MVHTAQVLGYSDLLRAWTAVSSAGNTGWFNSVLILRRWKVVANLLRSAICFFGQRSISMLHAVLRASLQLQDAIE